PRSVAARAVEVSAGGAGSGAGSGAEAETGAVLTPPTLGLAVIATGSPTPVRGGSGPPRTGEVPVTILPPRRRVSPPWPHARGACTQQRAETAMWQSRPSGRFDLAGAQPARDQPECELRRASGSGAGDDQTRARRASGVEARLDVGPVHDVPDGLDVVGLHVLVVEVEGVLPHVQLEQRDRRDRHTVLLVVELLDDELATDRLVRQDRPAGTLDAQRRRGEVRTEGIEGAEELIDRLRELTGGLVATLRREVLPEDRVVRVTAQVERQILRELVHRPEVPRLTGRGELLQRRVRAVDVGRVVLGVVQLHDLAGDRGIQRPVVVVEIRKRVVRHVDHPFVSCPRDLSMRIPPPSILPRWQLSWQGGPGERAGGAGSVSRTGAASSAERTQPVGSAGAAPSAPRDLLRRPR